MSTSATSLEQALGAAYHFERELGGGGMSRVFVARDTMLDRLIVVKVLPEYAAASVSAERFRREIMLAAKLQHPHIVPLISAGNVDGLPFYTMPFIEGQSLRERIAKEGELAIDDVVDILKDVAKALVYAHEHGIVHRDIKPANVMLAGGSAMVTDFGVAKALSSSAMESEATLTKHGVPIGTPAYMSPEQVSGDGHIDHRSDLYSFGCMAYELLCGTPPFSGRAQQALLGAHVSETPQPISRRRETVPPALSAIVMQCLEKHAADRPRSAADVLRGLEALASTTGGARALEGLPKYRLSWRTATRQWLRNPRTLGTLVVLAGVAAWGALRAPEERRVFQTNVAPTDHHIALDTGLALSPDGSRLVYTALGPDSAYALWVRPLNGLVARKLEGTTGAWAPAWSPDGRRIVYFAGQQLRIRTVDGGEDVVRCDSIVTWPEGASWGSRDVIVFAPRARDVIWAVHADTGRCHRVTRLLDGARGHQRPSFLPDGRHFVFGSGAIHSTFIGDLETGEQRRLRSDVSYGRFAAPGYLVFVQEHTVFAQRLDPRTLTLDGEAVAVLDHAQLNYASRPILDAQGDILVSAVQSGELPRLMRFRRSAFASPEVVRLPAGMRVINFSLSRDGTQIAISSDSGLFMHHLSTGITTNVLAASDTNGWSVDEMVWSPGDTVLAHTKSSGADMGIRLLDLRTREARQLLPWEKTFIYPDDWSPDGRTIVFRDRRDTTRRNNSLALLDVATGVVRQVLPPTRDYGRTVFSPDGRWLAFSAMESGKRHEVYVKRLAGGAEYRVSPSGGRAPKWIGRELLYIQPGRTGGIMSVTVTPGDRPTFGEPRYVLPYDGNRDFQVSRDGRELIVFYPAPPAALAVVQNWTELLKH